MKRFSPSQRRIYSHVYAVCIGLWIVWRLPDAEGSQFIVGVALLVLTPVAVVVTEVGYRRQRTETASEDGSRH